MHLARQESDFRYKNPTQDLVPKKTKSESNLLSKYLNQKNIKIMPTSIISGNHLR